MKAPLRETNSSTIEKLRAWLAAELDPLEINNNVQYAHHVVTIFLNDADVEDEPISPPNDYLRELDVLRAGKSLEQKKRAAVQFLKGVIPSGNQPIPSMIEQLIEELVERVDATKVKTPKKLICPINVNVEVSRRHLRSKKSRIEQESFDEAFPLLPAETRMAAVTVTVKKGACADGWLKSVNSSEAIQRSRKRSAAARKVTFVDKSEDAICMRAGLLHLIPVPDKHLSSPVTIQVDESFFETGIFSRHALRNHYESEWKSAFVKLLPTAKLYSPKKIRFPLPLDVSSPARPNSWPTVTIVCNDSLDQSSGIPRLADKVNILDEYSPKAFLHIEQRAPAMPPNSLFALDADDLEVSNIISWNRVNHEQMRRRRKELKLENRVVRQSHKENKDRNGPRNNSQSNFGYPDGNRNNENSQASPLLGAVGGSEVRTDDLIGFAMNQMEQFERNRSGSGGHGNDGPMIRQNAFDIVLPDREENVLAIHIGMGYNDEDGENERDSGMCPGGEEELFRLNLEGWAEGISSSCGWLDSASIWCNTAQSNAVLPKWRKTPGCTAPDDSSEKFSASTDDYPDTVNLAGVDAAVSQNWNDMVNLEIESNPLHGAQSHQNWDGWGDPIPIPGSTWNAMIMRDVYCLSTPPHTADANSTVDTGNIYQPPVLSSCVDTNVSKILQSAFVNAMFAQGMALDPTTEIQNSHIALDCSELEKGWLSSQSDENLAGAMSRRLNVVRGRTCSNWLEGVCHLGIACPFSHPSI